ncbi:RlpA-like double-psi beta-barrel-protein domain-containing protein-containing protein [Parasitella parasitica]|nr:RlpA-like double-psi beta-barrel-protein domain-containing protein-containing protein [Parasitella parasitica]
MRFTLSNLVILTVVISASLLFDGAQSVPLSPGEATVSINRLVVASNQLALDGHSKTEKSSKKATSKSSKSRNTTSHGSSKTFRGEGTFFSPNVGAGSCGKLYQDYEMVAALNIVQMQEKWPYPAKNPNTNPLCNKRIKVTNKANGASVRVKIVDTCPPCVKGDVDLSVEAFGKIAHHDTGRINITWAFED